MTTPKLSTVIGAVVLMAVSALPLVSVAANGASNAKSPVEIYAGSQATYAQLPPDKKREIDREANWLEKARQGIIPQAPKTDNPPEVPHPLAPFDSGIGAKEAPPGVSDLQVINIWRETLDNRKISIYAGANLEDAAQGVVLLDIMDLDNKTLTFKRIQTPSQEGAVHITKAESGILTVESESGIRFLLLT